MEKFRKKNALHLLNFLRNGDRFLLEMTHWPLGSDRVEFAQRTGTVAMDGHAVSKSYGWVIGGHHYDDPDKMYINVKFDDGEYGDRRSNNESIYVNPSKHGEYGDKMGPFKAKYTQFQLAVTPEVYDRIQRESKMTPEQLHPELGQTAAQKAAVAEIERIEQAMAKLATDLEAARQKL